MIVRVALPGGGFPLLLGALARHGVLVQPPDAADVDALLVRAGELPRFLMQTAASLPLLVIDGPADPLARAALLDGGAADVLADPADPAELAARLRAVLRTRRMPPIACADLTVDLVDRKAQRAGKPLPLHPREFAVLGELARHRDRPVDRLALFRAVWRRRFDPGTNVVAVTVSRMRAKVDHGFARPLIHTIGGAYMLSDAAVAMA
ncbi:MAG TPA: response regulator transcription factor [Sphingomonas sp.]